MGGLRTRCVHDGARVHHHLGVAATKVGADVTVPGAATVQFGRMRWPFLLLLLVTACGSAPVPRAPVGVYVSSPRTFRTNAHWIDGPEGVVLVDTMFTPSEGVAALEAAERATGKRVTHALVLHANPDKFNGTAALQARGVEVLTSAQVVALIPEVFALRTRWFGERYAPDWPESVPQPKAFGDQTTTLSLAGLELQVHVLGRGVSEAHIVLAWNGHVFTGDLLANGHHGWLEIGATSEWLERLDEIAALEPVVLHPGRGASAGPELIEQQRAYLRHIIELVAAEEPRLPIVEGAIARITSKVESAYPEHAHPVFLRLGIPAEYRRQALSREAAAASRSASPP